MSAAGLPRSWLPCVFGAALALTPTRAVAQAVEVDPDSAQVHSKALESLPRAQRLAVKGEEREIRPESRAIVGLNLGVAGKSADVSGLLRDLNADVRGKRVRIALSADVLFDFDKAELRPEAAPSLDKVVAVLKSYPKATVTIEGHTDSKGDEGYNQKLSQRRAESVRKWLAAHGAGMRMTTRGLGKRQPVAPNTAPDGKDDPQGRQKNRRVEIVVTQS
jgi:outer membrane protein OmpA-like peptidoglycan-associated protein